MADPQTNKPPRQQRENAADQGALDEARAKFLKRLRADRPGLFAIIDHVARHGYSAAAMSAGEMDIFPNLMVGSLKKLRRLYYLTDKSATARGDSAIKNCTWLELASWADIPRLPPCLD